MNERIQELAKQIGYIWHASGEPQIYEFTPEKLEKFAQLIVRECAEIAKHNVMNISTYADADFVDEQIKKHFGVTK